MNEKRFTMEILIKKAEMTTLILGKVDFKTRNTTRNKGRYFIMIRNLLIKKI